MVVKRGNTRCIAFATRSDLISPFSASFDMRPALVDAEERQAMTSSESRMIKKEATTMGRTSRKRVIERACSEPGVFLNDIKVLPRKCAKRSAQS